ncbi:MAG: amino acid ABC transporter permease [Pigmentiphaga sp.]|nr:amino acid ABC transporter permease [Pigmentiphaga sp.]
MFDLAFMMRNLPYLQEGLLVTLQLVALSITGALTGGALVAACTLSRWRVLNGLGRVYIEVMRNTPVLVQIAILYFGLPSIGLYPSAVLSAVLALSMQNSAYIGEIYRAAIQSVSIRQTESALALGMTSWAAFRHVVLPQASRRMFPPLGSQAIFIIKDTSIASTIAVAELTHTGKLMLDRSGAPYEVFLMIALLYLLLTSSVFLLVKGLEHRFPVKA